MEMNNSENIVEQSTENKVVLQYDDQFPPLPTSNMPKHVNKSLPRLTTIQSKNTNVSQTLIVPLAERRFATREGVAHNDAQKKICQSVAQKCGVSIELNSGLKDQNLSVFINGPLDKVLDAKKILSKELQTQGQLQLNVPKEYHKFILGRNGSTLREIENNSSTNITIPRAGDENDTLIIFGTKEGIEKAKNDIYEIVSERSKLGNERFTVPRRFYPFINGPNNSNINRIRETTNVKINIPPSQAESEDIIISGEKGGVNQAMSIIQKIYNDTKNISSTLNMPIPKCQHRYVIGPKGSGIVEILEKTGVSVEMPNQDSDDDTIVLFGPSEKLASALSLVIQKAESMLSVTLDAPNWLHRFIIGKSGSNLNKILENYVRVFVNFLDDSDSIIIEGPKEDVKELKLIIEEKIEELKRTMAVAELSVDPRFHRHIIGRNGTNIQRMQDDFKVQIRMPGSNVTGQNSWIIRIEGDPEGVKDAKSEMESMSVKLENEKSKDIIVDQKYHNQLIGTQGNKIKELRTLFPEVIITFPDSSSKSDVVQLRGAKQQVDQCALKFNKIIEDVIENNYIKEIRIFKKFHKNIIGKGGSNIKKIRDETNVRIDFPDENSDNDIVRLTGKKKEVNEAAKRIQAIQAELVSIKEVTINVPHKLHSSLIGVRGKLIKCLQEECGGVIVSFPSSESTSDIITIKGVESDVEKARTRILELAEKNQLLTYQESVSARSDFHKFLIGRKGVKMAEFRAKHSVMVMFPDSEDENKDIIQIVGMKDAVIKARVELESVIKALENEIEVVVIVDQKWHKHFFMRRQAVLEELSREFGGVRVFFPRQDASENVDRVRVIGAKDCVEAAVARVKEIVENLEAQTTISVYIDQKHHRNLITRNMPEIKSLQSEYDVMIKFPNRILPDNNGIEENNGHPLELGDAVTIEEDQNEESNPSNLVAISGRIENCEQAKEALLELVPVDEEVPLVNDYHRNFIGQKGQGINSFSTRYNVMVQIPQANAGSDYISLKGTLANIAEAKAALADLVDQWDREKADRVARNFELPVEVPVAYHRQLIGQRGANIEIFRTKFNVNIQIPDQSSGSSTIVIRGYEEDAKKASDELTAMVKRLDAQVKEELHIPREVHPLLIGTRGINLRKLRDQFKVEVNFPNRDAEGDKAQLVEVIGDKDNVDKCCDHLIERANELLDEFEERSQFRGMIQQTMTNGKDRRNGHSDSVNNKAQPGFMLSGAPWQQVPDALSNDDFPTMIDGSGDKASVINGHCE